MLRRKLNEQKNWSVNNVKKLEQDLLVMDFIKLRKGSKWNVEVNIISNVYLKQTVPWTGQLLNFYVLHAKKIKNYCNVLLNRTNKKKKTNMKN
jgi:hypothetical protein